MLEVLHVAEDEDLCGRLQEVAQAANGEEPLGTSQTSSALSGPFSPGHSSRD